MTAALRQSGITFDALCIGESMVMLTPAWAERLGRSGALAMTVAGAESNVAQYLADLGHRSAWYGRVGNDPLGEFVLQTLRSSGVEVDASVFDDDARTGAMFKDPDPNGSQIFYYRNDSAASRMTVVDLENIDLTSSRIVHVSGITPALSAGCRSLVWELLDRAGTLGVLRSFDVNYRRALWSPKDASHELHRLAVAADVVFVGRDEAESLWETPHSDAIRAFLGDHNPLVVKDAGVGATSYEPGVTEGVFVPTPPVRIVEPTGAGDAFASGYLSGILRGLPVLQRLELGHQVAAVALSSVADHVQLPFALSRKGRV